MARKRLYEKLKATLGEGAEITGIWLRVVTRKARQEWRVSFEAFQRNMRRLLEKNGINLTEGYIDFLSDFWRTAT